MFFLSGLPYVIPCFINTLLIFDSVFRPELLTDQVKQEMPSIPVCDPGESWIRHVKLSFSECLSEPEHHDNNNRKSFYSDTLWNESLLKPAEKVKTLHIFIVHESVFIYVSTSIHWGLKLN